MSGFFNNDSKASNSSKKKTDHQLETRNQIESKPFDFSKGQPDRFPSQENSNPKHGHSKMWG